MSFISRSLDLFVILYCTYIYGASGNEPNSHYQNVEQSENQRRRPTTMHSMPIACRVCDRVFFDNVSLVLHFECHLKDEIPTPGQHSRSPTSLQSDKHLSFNSAHFSCPFVERMSEARHIAVPGTNDYSRPCSLPVCSEKTPNGLLRDVSLVEIPVLNSIPPLNSSFDARWKLSQSTVHSTMSQKTATSSPSHPIFYPQLGTSRLPHGLAALPLQLNEQNGRGSLCNSRNPQINQLAEPCKEIIVISDDEEDENRSPVETLDLTLKL